MNKITKAWTYGVAYLSLAVGSGVSIAGNIADTYRVSEAIGRTPDSLDIAISGFWPAAVLLAIEMFVSRLWPKTKAMQTVRWVGSLGIGFVAMYVSWHHLADLLGSRGQDNVVATLGPLAIDGLAVMATGLILSSRGHRIDEVPSPSTMDSLVADEPMDSWLDRMNVLAAEMDSATTPAAPVEVIAPISAPPALVRSNEIRPESVPEDAAILIRTWEVADADDKPSASDMYALLAGDFGVSPRTVRRWRTALGR